MFEQQYGEQIKKKVEQGQLTVRQHMLPMLTKQSDPPGYSLDAANAALLAADEGKFIEFHDSLFAHQPEEGKRGYDKEQLIQLGRDLGITSDAFADGVRQGKYDDLLQQEMDRVTKDTSLHRDFGGGQRGFGTPTVVANGELVDLSDPAWLDTVGSSCREAERTWGAPERAVGRPEAASSATRERNGGPAPRCALGGLGLIP